MANVLYLHGLTAKPSASRKVQSLRAAGLSVEAPALDYFRSRFPSLVRRARAAFEKRRPDVLVAASLGAAVALALLHEVRAGHADAPRRAGADDGGPGPAVPLILVTPAWDPGRVRVQAGRAAARRASMGVLSVSLLAAAAAASAVSPAFAGTVAEIWGMRVVGRVPAETLILHAANDELIDARQSRALLAAGPAPLRTSGVNRVLSDLRALGYRTDAKEPRLLIIGEGHHCNEASATCPFNPGRSPRECLVAAALAWTGGRQKPGLSQSRSAQRL